MTPDKCEGGGAHLIRNSTIALEIGTKDSSSEIMSIFMYFEKNNKIGVNPEKLVHRMCVLTMDTKHIEEVLRANAITIFSYAIAL